MSDGVKLGIDVGTVRVGVARSDPSGMLAIPLVTLARDSHSVDSIAALVHEYEIHEIVVGLPLGLSGRETSSTSDAEEFARAIQEAVAIPVWLVDERLTTVSAHSALRASGRKPSRSRSVVDQVAAVMLLQHVLDSLASTGAIPGSRVTG